MGESVSGPVYCKSGCDDREYYLRHRNYLYADTQSSGCRPSHRATGPSDARAFSLGRWFQLHAERCGDVPGRRDRRQSTREGIEAVLKIWTDPEPGHYKSDFWEFKIPEDRPNIVSVHMKPYQKTASTDCDGGIVS